MAFERNHWINDDDESVNESDDDVIVTWENDLDDYDDDDDYDNFSSFAIPIPEDDELPSRRKEPTTKSIICIDLDSDDEDSVAEVPSVLQPAQLAEASATEEVTETATEEAASSRPTQVSEERSMEEGSTTHERSEPIATKTQKSGTPALMPEKISINKWLNRLPLEEDTTQRTQTAQSAITPQPTADTPPNTNPPAESPEQASTVPPTVESPKSPVRNEDESSLLTSSPPQDIQEKLPREPLTELMITCSANQNTSPTSQTSTVSTQAPIPIDANRICFDRQQFYSAPQLENVLLTDSSDQPTAQKVGVKRPRSKFTPIRPKPIVNETALGKELEIYLRHCFYSSIRNKAFEKAYAFALRYKNTFNPALEDEQLVHFLVSEAITKSSINIPNFKGAISVKTIASEILKYKTNPQDAEPSAGNLALSPKRTMHPNAELANSKNPLNETPPSSKKSIPDKPSPTKHQNVLQPPSDNTQNAKPTIAKGQTSRIVQDVHKLCAPNAKRSSNSEHKTRDTEPIKITQNVRKPTSPNATKDKTRDKPSEIMQEVQKPIATNATRSPNLKDNNKPTEITQKQSAPSAKDKSRDKLIRNMHQQEQPRSTKNQPVLTQLLAQTNSRKRPLDMPSLDTEPEESHSAQSPQTPQYADVCPIPNKSPRYDMIHIESTSQQKLFRERNAAYHTNPQVAKPLQSSDKSIEESRNSLPIKQVVKQPISENNPSQNMNQNLRQPSPNNTRNALRNSISKEPIRDELFNIMEDLHKLSAQKATQTSMQAPVLPASELLKCISSAANSQPLKQPPSGQHDHGTQTTNAKSQQPFYVGQQYHSGVGTASQQQQQPYNPKQPQDHTGVGTAVQQRQRFQATSPISQQQFFASQKEKQFQNGIGLTAQQQQGFQATNMQPQPQLNPKQKQPQSRKRTAAEKRQENKANNVKSPQKLSAKKQQYHTERGTAAQQQHEYQTTNLPSQQQLNILKEMAVAQQQQGYQATNVQSRQPQNHAGRGLETAQQQHGYQTTNLQIQQQLNTREELAVAQQQQVYQATYVQSRQPQNHTGRGSAAQQQQGYQTTNMQPQQQLNTLEELAVAQQQRGYQTTSVQQHSNTRVELDVTQLQQGYQTTSVQQHSNTNVTKLHQEYKTIVIQPQTPQYHTDKGTAVQQLQGYQISNMQQQQLNTRMELSVIQQQQGYQTSVQQPLYTTQQQYHTGVGTGIQQQQNYQTTNAISQQPFYASQQQFHTAQQQQGYQTTSAISQQHFYTQQPKYKIINATITLQAESPPEVCFPNYNVAPDQTRINNQRLNQGIVAPNVGHAYNVRIQTPPAGRVAEPYRHRRSMEGARQPFNNDEQATNHTWQNQQTLQRYSENENNAIDWSLVDATITQMQLYNQGRSFQ